MAPLRSDSSLSKRRSKHTRSTKQRSGSREILSESGFNIRLKRPFCGLTGTWLTVWVTVACATDMALLGYDQGAFGGAVVTPDFLDKLNLNNNSSLISTVTAIYGIGCFFGAVSVCAIGDPLGRKNFVTGSASWRVPLAFKFLFIIILLAPGRADEVERILADLEAADVDNPYIITQSKDIQWAVQYEKDYAVCWRDLLRGRAGDQAGTHTIRRVSLGMGTQAMQQLSSTNVTSYYLATVLIESVGLSNNLACLLAACNSVSCLLFYLISIPNVEHWGRRKMMMYAAAGQFFCYTIITICIRSTAAHAATTSLSPTTNQPWAKGSIAFFFLYSVFFDVGWQGVAWLYPTEINSMIMRTKGAALGTATNCWQFYIWCVFNFAFIRIGEYFPPRLPPVPSNDLAVYFFYPETTGCTLEDLDRYFRGDAPLFWIKSEKPEIRRHSSVVTGDVAAANDANQKKSRTEGAEYHDDV
ncbi:hypothetical protein BU25DRAFT_438776 [Macroventuria anomochaeta]|uniref:Uncharacterized protein n=1 Tax=Macroventuria anomochaeta TaxID=301207 RepID=A0ACB6S588_9PLEO|nr:uncharacterized protein BU25DRAFT_438776 [Macroventuria anomochaeta]KAF2629209.1 hypothetical protein BU25DRAFT_438776 [Macroventuria anomochaeta]